MSERDRRTGDGIESNLAFVPSPIPVPIENFGGPISLKLHIDVLSDLILHNHPSGDPSPSSADVEMTRQVVEAGRSLRITVHDHLVVGRDGVASLTALGLF